MAFQCFRERTVAYKAEEAQFGRISQSWERFKPTSLKHYELSYFWLSFTYFGKYNLPYTVAAESIGQRMTWGWDMGMEKQRWRMMNALGRYFTNYLCLQWYFQTAFNIMVWLTPDPFPVRKSKPTQQHFSFSYSYLVFCFQVHSSQNCLNLTFTGSFQSFWLFRERPFVNPRPLGVLQR